MIRTHGAISAAGTINATLQGDAFNAVCVTKNGAWGSSDYLTMVLSGKGRSDRNLANRIPMKAFAGLSDFENGNSAALRTFLGTIVVPGGVPTAANTTNYSCIIPIGCLHPSSTQEQLEVSVEGGDAKKYSLASVMVADMPDHSIAYKLGASLSQSMGNCIRAYLYASAYTATIDPSGKDITTTVNAGGSSRQATLMDVAGYTAAAGQIEAAGPDQVFCIYRSPVPYGEPVQVDISGANASDVQILLAGVEYTVGGVSRSNMGSIDRAIMNLSSRPVEEQRALVRAQLALPVQELRTVRAKLNSGVEFTN